VPLVPEVELGAPIRVDLARRYFTEVMNQGKLEVINEIMAPGFQFIIPTQPVHSGYDEMAGFVGKEHLVSSITKRSMNGEIDFTQSLRQRCALLGGVTATVFEQLKPVITLAPGARELCRALKSLGYKLAVLSGGFLPLVNYIKDELGLDYAYANQLAVSDDGSHLTGELTGDIINAARKAELLQQLAHENGIPLHQTMAIGDGANDLKMMEVAGLGIAFNAKPMVQLEAPSHLNLTSLQDVLYILGLSKEEQAQLL